MPSLDWNRKWGAMISGFVSGADEEHFGDRWGHPDSFTPLLEVRRRFIEPYFSPGSTVLEIGSGGGRKLRSGPLRRALLGPEPHE